ncbi:hypothetical protein DBIPINDM_002945 [Mesorhizobium sp. AR02]|uniref:hypothetical protein n=1 Tax=Mesorhizobium sp. AR02 TaxID=2865837 RepID=UPI00215ECC48|nr:hypothetical protein [Mesorhizobium sp. AR02]UVK56347.1 hypothetical protein DBIPINDM_002945 [Mesorhizobium sp. AR02]
MGDLSKVDWPGIIREAAHGPLGIVALVVLVLGIASVALFAKEANPRFKFSAYATLSFALVVFVLLILPWGGDGGGDKPGPWKPTTACAFDKQISDMRAEFQIDKFPADSHDDSSLILWTTLWFPTDKYAPSEQSALCPRGYGWVQGFVTFGNARFETPGNGGISQPDPNDKNDCSSLAQQVVLIRAQGLAQIGAVFKDWAAAKGILRFRISNGPQRDVETVIPLRELEPLLSNASCPAEVRNLIAGLPRSAWSP